MKEQISDATNSSGTPTHRIVSDEKIFLLSPFNLCGWRDNREFYDFVCNMRWPLTFYHPNAAQDYCIYPYDMAINGTQWGCHHEWNARVPNAQDANSDFIFVPYVVIGQDNV